MGKFERLLLRPLAVGLVGPLEQGEGDASGARGSWRGKHFESS